MIKEKKAGQLIVISAPSGSVIAGLLKNDSKNRWLSVSTTSREIRTNDIPGITYNFVTKEEFEEKIKDGYFLEYTNYVGNYYGTPKEFIKQKLDAGIDVILEIEIEGASNIKKLIPEAIFIFIMPPSLKILVEAIEKVEAIIKAEKCRIDRIEEVYLDTKEEEIHELLINDKDFDNENLSNKIN